MADAVNDTHALNPGDVVVFGPGDSRTVHHVELTPTSRFARVGWADGRSSVVARFRAWTRLASGPAPRGRAAPTPPPTPPTPPTSQDGEPQ